MSRLFPRCYEALIMQGHPPARATYLLLGARRGDCFSLVVVRCIVRLRRDQRDRMRTAIRKLCEMELSL